MTGRKTIRNLRVRNLLSFGAQGVNLTLEPLNILIGPNGEGKSNFLEAIRLLHSMPNGVDSFLETGSLPEDYLWKGAEDVSRAKISCRVTSPVEGYFDHSFELASDLAEGFYCENEVINRKGKSDLKLFQKTDSGLLAAKKIEVESNGKRTSEYRFEAFDRPERKWDTIIHKDFSSIPFLGQLERIYNKFAVYGSQSFGRNAEPRKSQKADLDQSVLFEDSSNLANVFAAFQHDTPVMSKMNRKLQEFYPNAIRLIVGLSGNRVSLFVEEKDLIQTIPATRLSDGTIRFLSLVALLLHPSPPPVIAIEEPEIGLHPDMIRLVGKMLIEASSRCQLFITTHSEVLVSAVSQYPESVLVCRRGFQGTEIDRLDAKQLNPWLEKYSLGELWLSGEIGGVRE